MLFDPTRPEGRGWTLILPVKGGASAKSRLGGGPDLARAIALDCLDAVLRCPHVTRVTVVTADRSIAGDALRAGAAVVPERVPGSGLVAAVRTGVDAAASDPSTARLPCAVLLGDLPALRPVDLSCGLHAAGATLLAHRRAPMAALPDAHGSGTVLLAARRPKDLHPAFGPDSLAEHRRRGAVPIDLTAARLRHDVDTPADLQVALTLGVGPRTAARLAAAGTGPIAEIVRRSAVG